jgi:predicted membrane-bound dolichyl-phosphate-mannose-protein mannosyltransferase
MKTIQGLILMVIVLGMNSSCSAQTKKEEASTRVSKSDKVEVYYFHYTRRCATCNAVESVSKEALAELYGSKVQFTDYNLDEEAGETKGKELKVSGQSLIIVAGDTKINITNEGFMNARSNPDKLKAIIKEKIDPLL